MASDLNLFYALLLAQVGMLGYLVLAGKPAVAKPGVRIYLQPQMWFVAWFTLTMLIPQIMLPIYGFRNTWGVVTLMYGDIGVEASIRAQLTLICYLGAICLGFGVTTAKPVADEITVTREDNERETRLLKVFLAIGFVALAYLLVTIGGLNARSELVKTPTGKVAYALSFFATFAAPALAGNALLRRKYLSAAVIVLVAGLGFFFLGGRGRVLWPTVHLICFLGIANNVRFRPILMGSAGIALYVIMSTLDPLLAVTKGAELSMDTLIDISRRLDVSSMFLGSVFGSFLSLGVITYLDWIPHQLSFLATGASGAYMTMYFPAVFAQGVGFPATAPGELFLSGGHEVVIIMGAVYGLLLGWARRGYWRMNSTWQIWTAVIASQWLTAVGNGFLDSQTKIIAAVLPPILLGYLLNRTRLGERSPQATPPPQASSTEAAG